MMNRNSLAKNIRMELGQHGKLSLTGIGRNLGGAWSLHAIMYALEAMEDADIVSCDSNYLWSLVSEPTKEFVFVVMVWYSYEGGNIVGVSRTLRGARRLLDTKVRLHWMRDATGWAANLPHGSSTKGDWVSIECVELA